MHNHERAPGRHQRTSVRRTAPDPLQVSVDVSLHPTALEHPGWDGGRNGAWHGGEHSGWRSAGAAVATAERRTDQVLALVLTHSSPTTLAACVHALLAQTRPPDHVLVIDNAGEPPAATVLPADPRVEVVRRRDNSGPAGGHAFGLSEFLRRDSGPAWAWVMDDDVIPAPGCLEELLRVATSAGCPRVVWPRIRDVSGRPHDYPGWCGVLLAREVVDGVGVPMAELVWWTEDTEYLQRRIPLAGYEPVTAEAAAVVHLNARDEATTPPWKVYYQVRNSIYYRVHVQRLAHPWRLLRVLARTFGGAVIPPGPRAERVGRWFQGLVDGIFARLGPRVAPGS